MKLLKKQELKCAFLKLREHLMKNPKMILIVSFSVLLILILLFSEISTESESEEETKTLCQSYDRELEERLSELISSIDGAGETKVMITLENGEESVYARNSGLESDEGENIRTQSSQEYVIIKSGNDETGLHLKTVYPRISGVAVVCHGAESAYVKQRIISTVTAVLGISSAKVSVVKMESKGDINK